MGVKLYGQFHIPKTKAELIERLRAVRPEWKVSELRSMSKRQLYAIWFRICRQVHGGKMPGEGGGE